MKLASVYGHIAPKRLLVPWHEWPIEKCHIGLEWEFEMGHYLRDAVLNMKHNVYFQIHNDGSLRDNGVEITTAGDGLFGLDLYTAMKELDALIKTLRHSLMEPVCNYRTGFHAHLDIRDMEEREIHNLLIIYCLLEKPIFNFVGGSRWDSNFCVPWFRSDSQFEVLKLIETLNDKNANMVSAQIKALQRYSALNCQSIAKFGTLEFRHMQNDSYEIMSKQIDFIKIIMLLKKLAQAKYKQGLSGAALFEYFKGRTPREVIKEFGYNLPIEDWDYPETLMSCIGLVNFTFPVNKAYFFDAVFDKFFGTHPNWK